VAANEVGEEFAVPIGALDAGLDEAAPFEVGLTLDEVLDALASAGVGLGIADDAAGADVFAGEFELGLHQDESLSASL
jgi:hypothetical protein